MSDNVEISYVDQLLADGTVYRRYSDGLQEWRRRAGDRIEWRDAAGGSGTDEQIGRKIVKRTYANGRVAYGRDLGYGRTAWRFHPANRAALPSSHSGRARLAVTVNRSAFRGRVAALIASLGAGALLFPVIAPPAMLSAAEEEELRRALQAQSTSSEADLGWGDDGFSFSEDFG